MTNNNSQNAIRMTRRELAKMAFSLFAAGFASTQASRLDAGEVTAVPCGKPMPVVPPNAISYSHFLSEITPRKLLIVSPQNRQSRLREQDIFANAFANQLTKCGMQRVAVATSKVCDQVSPLETGRFDEHQLVQYSQKYFVDSVLYFDVVHMSAYAPMSMRVLMVLVSCNEAVALASGNVLIDLSNKSTFNSFQRSVVQDPKKLSYRAHSPTQFITFSANMIANEMKRGMAF